MDSVLILNVLDLFSGVGGFSLGLERTDVFRTVAFCETEPFARRVLAKHWPRVPVYGDIRHLNAAILDMHGIPRPDVLCGGFPCQDLSLAGKGAGLDGARSGLWFEYLRLIEETRPDWIVIENVPPLRSRGLDTVLGGISALRYDAWWDGIPASAIGAHHQRDRIWIVAHAYGNDAKGRGASSDAGYGGQGTEPGAREPIGSGCVYPVSDSHGEHAGARRPGRSATGSPGQPEPVGTLHDSSMADADGTRLAFWQGFRSNLEQELEATKRDSLRDGGVWNAEPNVGRVVDGFAARLVGPGKDVVARATWESELKALGNHLVYRIPEAIGRAIVRSVSYGDTSV